MYKISKKHIETELNKELNMELEEGYKLICRFANGQELKFFKNDSLKKDILKLVKTEKFDYLCTEK